MKTALWTLPGLSASRWCAALPALSLAASCALSAAQAAVPLVKPAGPPLKSSAGFSVGGEKARRAASGMACVADAARRRCLVVFDEGVKAQFADLTDTTLHPVGEPITLLSSAGELDAEGATTDGRYFYVVGSHSVKRKDCESNRTSRHLIRFKLGAPQGNSPGLSVSGLQDTTTLWDSMMGEPSLKAHADGCLGTGKGGRKEQKRASPGLNIEGIAAAGGRLYLGFRGPSEAGVVPVYSVEAAALFDGTAAKPRLSMLPVGRHLGIRDMVAGKTALLLLLGPDDSDPPVTQQWHLAEWQDNGAAGPGNTPRVLATLDTRGIEFNTCAKELKPEAIAILDETPAQYRVVVLSDGVCDGGGLVFNVAR